MMTVEVNEETSRCVGILVELALPVWRWQIILRRADELFAGDLGQCLCQLLDAGFMSEIKLLSVRGKEVMN